MAVARGKKARRLTGLYCRVCVGVCVCGVQEIRRREERLGVRSESRQGKGRGKVGYTGLP